MDSPSPSSSTEELAQINEPPEGIAMEDTDSPSHQLVKPEPTKAGSKVVGPPQPPQQPYLGSGSYGNKQAPPSQGHAYPAGDQSLYHVSLSQPVVPSQQILSHTPHTLPTQPPSLSQGDRPPPYYTTTQQQQQQQHPHPGNQGGEVGGASAGPAPYPGQYASRQKMSYENVPMVYENLKSKQQRHAPVVPHPHNTTKYGNMTSQQSGQQRNYNPARDRAHDPHMITEYPPSVMHPAPPTTSYPAARRKQIKPANVGVAHTAAAAGDIATLVRSKCNNVYMHVHACMHDTYKTHIMHTHTHYTSVSMHMHTHSITCCPIRR